MTNKILEQCERSIGKFEKLLPIEWTERSVLDSEAFCFCAMCDMFDVDYVVESGTYNGRSAEIWARYMKSRPVTTIDVNIRQEANDRLYSKDPSKLLPYVNIVKGDGRFKIKEMISQLPNKKLGIFIDGPKGVEAVNWAKRFIQNDNVKFVGIHDCHKISFGKRNVTRDVMEEYKGKQFYTDYEPFVKKYKNLDVVDLNRKDEDQKIMWTPYRIIDDSGADRRLGSYGPTIGFLY